MKIQCQAVDQLNSRIESLVSAKARAIRDIGTHTHMTPGWRLELANEAVAIGNLLIDAILSDQVIIPKLSLERAPLFFGYTDAEAKALVEEKLGTKAR